MFHTLQQSRVQTIIIISREPPDGFNCVYFIAVVVVGTPFRRAFIETIRRNYSNRADPLCKYFNESCNKIDRLGEVIVIVTRGGG